MTISLREARDRAEAEIRSRRAELWPGDEYVIVDDDTLEREWGWVFFYTSRRWVETGSPRYRVARNVPMIVNRHDGSVQLVQAGRDTADYITRYETEYERDRRGWHLVLLDVTPDDPEHLAALRETLDLVPAEIRELVRRIPTVLMSGSRLEMMRYCEALTIAGISADVRRA